MKGRIAIMGIFRVSWLDGKYFCGDFAVDLDQEAF
jgi:hypothetical protein